MAGFGQVASKGCNWQNDVALPDPPKDSISGLSWSPASNHLAVSAWDNSVRIYEVGQQAAQGGRIVGGYEHSQPALDVCWSNDGSKVFSGGVDNAARMLDVQTGTSSQVASHNAPVRSVRWTDMHNGLLVTASWDKTLKYWDTRTPTPIAQLELADRCFAMDIKQNALVVAVGERHFQLIDLANPGAFAGAPIESQLKFQTRSLAVMPDAIGWAYGGLDGRVAVQFIPPEKSQDKYTFRCHRIANPPVLGKNDTPTPQIYSVNAVAFHPVYRMSLVSAGSDGCYTLWEIKDKKKLQDHDLRNVPINVRNQAQQSGFPVAPPITAAAFNNVNNGNIMAYSSCYDWSYGHRGALPNYPNKIMLHELVPEEFKAKK